MIWDLVSAASSVIGTVLLVVAAVVAFKQLRESLAARQLAATVSLVDKMQSSSLRGLRGYLNAHRSEIRAVLDGEKPLSGLDELLQRHRRLTGCPGSLVDLRQILASLEHVSVLSLHSQIPLALERAYVASSVLTYWRAVEPVVQAVRDSSGDAIFMQHMESVVRIAMSGELFGRKVRSAKRRELKRVVGQGRQGVALRTNEIEAARRGREGVAVAARNGERPADRSRHI